MLPPLCQNSESFKALSRAAVTLAYRANFDPADLLPPTPPGADDIAAWSQDPLATRRGPAPPPVRARAGRSSSPSPLRRHGCLGGEQILKNL